MIDVKVWIMVNENGNYDVSTESDDLRAEEGCASRLVCITLKIPTPGPVELEATIEPETQTDELKVA